MKRIFPPEMIRNSAEKHFSTFSRKSHVIYTSILLFVAAAIVSLFLITTEITVLSRGIIRSAKEPIPVTIPANAVIHQSMIRENSYVHAGDTLLRLDKEKLVKRINHLKGLLKENSQYIHDLAQLLKGKSRTVELKTALFKKSGEEYQQHIAEFDLEIALLQKKYHRTKILFDKQVIPDAEIEEKEFQLTSKTEEKALFIKLTHNKWQRLATEYKSANKKFKSEIDALKEDLEHYFIVAPHTGYISDYTGVLAGNFVTSGQVIGMIQPVDSLISEHLVPPKDIGLLQTDMDALFQIDAFDYNQWGLATGKITAISKDIYVINSQPFFKVRCKFNEKHLELQNGYKGELRKGLTNTARFIVTERTLAQLLFDKTDDWLNPNTLNE